MKKILILLGLLIFSCNTEQILVQQPLQKVEIDKNTTITQLEDGSMIFETWDDFNEEEPALKASANREVLGNTTSPSTINAHAEQLITITGEGFGNVKGRVYFGSYIAYGGMIVEWTNTKVVTQFPAVNRGSYSVTLKIADGITTIATSSNVYVNWGVYKVSSSDGLGSYKLFRPNYVDQNLEGGRTYYTSLGTSSSARSRFQEALNYINTETGLKLKLGGSVDVTTNNYNDNIFVLAIEEGVGAGRATVVYQNCGDDTFYARDGFASFDNVPSLAVAIHEICHTLFLGHATGVMCGNTSCVTSTFSQENRDAINHIMGYSITEGVSCHPKIEGTPTPIPDPTPTVYTFYQDLDNDGFGSNITITNETNIKPNGYARQGGDCNDSNPNINPGAYDVPRNGIDEDCDGRDAKGKGRPKNKFK